VGDSVLRSLRSCVVYNSNVLAVVCAALVRSLASFVHVSVGTLCRTGLCMFAGACGHRGLVVARALRTLY